jgi:hypothetical protein
LKSKNLMQKYVDPPKAKSYLRHWERRKTKENFSTYSRSNILGFINTGYFTK